MIRIRESLGTGEVGSNGNSQPGSWLIGGCRKGPRSDREDRALGGGGSRWGTGAVGGRESGKAGQYTGTAALFDAFGIVHR